MEKYINTNYGIRFNNIKCKKLLSAIYCSSYFYENMNL